MQMNNRYMNPTARETEDAGVFRQQIAGEIIDLGVKHGVDYSNLYLLGRLRNRSPEELDEILSRVEELRRR